MTTDGADIVIIEGYEEPPWETASACGCRMPGNGRTSPGVDVASVFALICAVIIRRATRPRRDDVLDTVTS